MVRLSWGLKKHAMHAILDPMHHMTFSSLWCSFWDIRETVTFLDPGFHETTQEEFDGDIKDRPTSLKDIKKWEGV